MDDFLLSIGELAGICNVTPKTLRHYDRLGLLKPAKIDSQNGYRFYKKEHITRVIAIKQLQEIGISLEQIGGFYGVSQPTDILGELDDILTNQEKEVRLKLEEYNKKLDRIHLMLHQCSQIKEQLFEKNNDYFIIKNLPDRKIIYKEHSGIYSTDIFRDYYRIIWNFIVMSGLDIGIVCSPPLAMFQSSQWTESITLHIGYQVNTELHLEGVENKIIKAGKYVCDIYQGPHGALKKEFYERLYANIKKDNYNVTGEPIEIYHISEVHTRNNDNYCTEVQIPIEKKD